MLDTNKLAIFISTSDTFFAGTCVALSSFLNNNAWFNGDIVVVSDDLSIDQAQFLNENFENLRLLEVEPRLMSQTQILKEEFPRLGNRARIFYNLQVFCLNQLNAADSLPAYDRVLKIDADMLFRGDIENLFELTSDIAASPSRLMYLGKSRSKNDLSVVSNDEPSAFAYWTSAGLYSVSGKCLNEDNYSQLLNYMSIEFWGNQKSNHTDQLGINILFDGRIEVLSPTHNYLLPHEKIIQERTGISAKEALVWHFVGKDKPWLLNRISEVKKQSAFALHAQQQWLKTYNEFGQKNLLKAVSSQRV